MADFAVDGALEAGSLVTLDGSASRDPDPGDGITSYSWSVEADGAPCSAPQVASTDPVVHVRFGCAGRFHARLIVVDRKLVESAEATRPLEIQARSGPAVVEAGPDQVVAHLCSGTPVACRLAGAIQLAATVTTETAVTLRWSVQPPAGRELDEHRRVRFLPDASAPNPTVEIETDGTGISGDWQFRVEVLDEVGVLDADVARLSVTNHAPLLSGGPSGPFDHTYDPTSRTFTAGGTFPLEVFDEDGDPVERQIAIHHTGDGGAAFVGEDLGTAIQFSVAVPFAAPEDALFLRGAEGLDRAIEVTVQDVNGAATSTSYPVEIGNRPPNPMRWSQADAQHTYDRAASAYVSEPEVGRWVDPDADPLEYVIGADPDCPTYSVQADGTVRLRCSRQYTSTGTLSGFVGARRARVQVQDPWASAAGDVSFRIGNRAPIVSAPTLQPLVECRPHSSYDMLCPGTGSGMDPANVFLATTFYVPLGVRDPDDDPVDVRWLSGAAATTCGISRSCTLTVLWPRTVSCQSTPPDTRIPYVATDGVASSSGSVLIDPGCR